MNNKDLKIWSIDGKLFFPEDPTTYKVVNSEIVSPTMEKAKDLFKRTFLAESQKNMVTLSFYDDSCIEITEDLYPSEDQSTTYHGVESQGYVRKYNYGR